MTATTTRLAPGDPFPPLDLTSLAGAPVTIPDPDATVHLQLRRFAGCPICNLHLRSMAARSDDLLDAGIHEVVVFHSTVDELRTYQDELPFDVVADPERELYRRFGVERTARAVLDPRAWRALPGGLAGSARSALRDRRAPLPAMPTGGNLGLPADLLVAPDGRVAAAKYGEHAYDQWSADEVLARVGRGVPQAG